MKLTKREKILLSLLAVLLIVALLFMYGILPAKETVDKQKTQITSLEDEVNDLRIQLARNNAKSVQRTINKNLEDYYNTNSNIWDFKNDTQLERDLILFFRSCGIDKIKNTTAWKNKPKKCFGTVEGIGINYDLNIASVKCSFKYENYEQINNLIKKSNEIDSLIINKINFKVEEEIDEKGNNKGYSYTGNVEISVYMLPKVNNNLPQIMETIKNVKIKDNKLLWDNIEKAKKYEIYEISNLDDKIEYNLIKDIYADNKLEIQSYKLCNLNLENGEHKIAIRAVGDGKEYFKSKLTDMEIISINIK